MVQLRPSSKIFPGFLGQDGLKHISLDTKHKNWDQSVDCFHPVISRKKKFQFDRTILISRKYAKFQFDEKKMLVYMYILEKIF